MSDDTSMALLFPLADAVQFTLHLCQDAKDKPQSIRGYGNFNLPLDDELISFKCVVVASGVSHKDAYILVHVMGDLYALVAYDSVMGEVTLTVLDGAVMKNNIVAMNGKSLFDVCTAWLPAARGMWMRTRNNKTWSRLDAIEGMDDPTVASPEEAGWPDHSVGTG